MRAEKQFAVDEIKEKLEEARSFVVTRYAGLSAEKMNEFRSLLFEQSANYMVVNNRLLKIAAREAGKERLTEFVEGPVGIIFGSESYSGFLRELVKFNKENQLPEILGGYVEERFFGAENIKSIANLPSKEELQAKLLAGLQAPISTLVGVLKQRITSFVRLLDAIARKKAESEETKTAEKPAAQAEAEPSEEPAAEQVPEKLSGKEEVEAEEAAEPKEAAAQESAESDEEPAEQPEKPDKHKSL